jgi:hypothetical protein
MDTAQSAELIAQHGGPVLGNLELLLLILSFLDPIDAIWCKEVCKWWHGLLRTDKNLSAQILRNNVHPYPFSSGVRDRCCYPTNCTIKYCFWVYDTLISAQYGELLLLALDREHPGAIRRLEREFGVNALSPSRWK